MEELLGNPEKKDLEGRLVHGFFLCRLGRWKHEEGGIVARMGVDMDHLGGRGAGTLAVVVPWGGSSASGGQDGGT